jgi:hypothetical protein
MTNPIRTSALFVKFLQPSCIRETKKKKKVKGQTNKRVLQPIVWLSFSIQVIRLKKRLRSMQLLYGINSTVKKKGQNTGVFLEDPD